MKIFAKGKILNLLCVIALSFALAACGSSEASNSGSATSDETITLRLGHQANEGVTYFNSAEKFAEEMEERTDGKIKIEVYPAAQLGNEVEMTKEVQQGSLDMVITSTGPLSNFAADFAVFQMPFLFDDVQHVYDSLEGEFGQLLNEKAEEVGMKNLGYIGNGFKSLSNSKRPILNAEDLKGLQMRVNEDPLTTDVYRALGADPTPIAAPEMYTALQQGVAHGYEGDMPAHDNFKIFEVTDYLSEIQMTFSASLILINQDLFDSFEPEIQDIFLELGAKYAKDGTVESEKMEKALFQEAIDSGVEVTRKADGKIDIESLKEAVQPIYEKNSQFDKYISAIE
ncbi:TRAP transporter substrate-binding protein [Siminovitchia sediminis]|uniref:TRAP transporter substrate-binding protein n=1 Tax=Siminovitchia sediminis TaxID=1274353 RepID=A0ABW4KP03_9BACI